LRKRFANILRPPPTQKHKPKQTLPPKKRRKMQLLVQLACVLPGRHPLPRRLLQSLLRPPLPRHPDLRPKRLSLRRHRRQQLQSPQSPRWFLPQPRDLPLRQFLLHR